jgi:hypothetical protein
MTVPLCAFDAVLNFSIYLESQNLESRPTGRVPSDAILFTTPKKYAKRLISCGGHFFRLWSVLYSATKIDEYLCAAWQRKPGPAFLNPLNERTVVFSMTGHENIPCSLFGFQPSCQSLQQPQYKATTTTTAQQQTQNRAESYSLKTAIR